MKENLAATLPMTCLDDITRLAGLEELVGRSDLVRLDKSCNLIDYPDLSDQLTLTLTFTHSRIHSLLPSIQLAVPIKNENPAQLKRTHAHTRADTHTHCVSSWHRCARRPWLALRELPTLAHSIYSILFDSLVQTNLTPSSDEDQLSSLHSTRHSTGS